MSWTLTESKGFPRSMSKEMFKAAQLLTHSVTDILVEHLCEDKDAPESVFLFVV